MNGLQLFDALGVRGLYWCGLFLRRRDLFGDPQLQGDVDIIGGPMEFDLSREEWEDLWVAEARARSLDADPSWIQHGAVLRALAAGRLQWPPNMSKIVGCEVKASWFEPETGLWKASHASEARKVRGQLQVLLDKGLNRCAAFLHLGATKPKAVGPTHPWFEAGEQAARALENMPFVYEPSKEAAVGYFRAVVGALPFATEDHAGSGGSLLVEQDATERLVQCEPWREQLRARLGQLPRPLWPQTYVVDDEGWYLRPRPFPYPVRRR